LYNTALLTNEKITFCKITINQLVLVNAGLNKLDVGEDEILFLGFFNWIDALCIFSL
jgi:hypothetical protein